MENLQEYIIIAFENSAYKIIKNTFKENVNIDKNGIITLPRTQLSAIWARSQIGNLAYGFGIYENGLTAPENLLAFDSRLIEDISVLNCLYHGNKIRISSIIMNSGPVPNRTHISYSEGRCANLLKYPTIITIATIKY